MSQHEAELSGSPNHRLSASLWNLSITTKDRLIDAFTYCLNWQKGEQLIFNQALILMLLEDQII